MNSYGNAIGQKLPPIFNDRFIEEQTFYGIIKTNSTVINQLHNSRNKLN